MTGDNVIHVAFPGRLTPQVSLEGSTELVFEDELAALFRFTVSVNGELLVVRHVLVESDDPQSTD